jgi:hypothetical protein
MSKSVSRLSAHTVEVLDRALASVSTTSGLAQRSGPTGSRQARHARLARGTALAVAACGLLAAEHDEFASTFLSPDFATLRPLSARVHSKFVYLMAQRPPTRGALERLWSHGMRRLFEVAPSLSDAPRDETLSVHAALTLMFSGPLAYGPAFETSWRQAWQRAEREGLLDNQHLRMQLAVMGTHVGQPGPHLDWLLEARSRPHEMADIYCFVRKDDSEDLLELNAKHIRGGEIDPLDALYPPKPLSTVRLVLRYVRTCMRDTSHFSNGGQALMLLYWVADVARHIGELQRVSSPEETRSIMDELRATEHVMLIEKARFWSVHDGLEPGPLRERLVELWGTRCSDPAPEGQKLAEQRPLRPWSRP